MIKPADLIERFGLIPHPEGGYYQRTYTASDDHFSSILFLLLRDNFSAFHRIRADEQWNWFSGDDIHIHEIDTNGNYTETILSGKTGRQHFQHVVQGGHWFASSCKGEQAYAFCGCTVIPAFHFSDFELGKREALLQQFPQHRFIIEQYTRA